MKTQDLSFSWLHNISYNMLICNGILLFPIHTLFHQTQISLGPHSLGTKKNHDILAFSSMLVCLLGHQGQFPEKGNTKQ